MTLVQHPTDTADWEPSPFDLEPAEPRSSIDGDRDQARVLTRIQAAAADRLMRMTWQQVADRNGYASRGAAANAVLGYMRRLTSETVATLRDQESAGLDRAAAALWPKVLQGDARAQDTWLRNRARFAALNGLNAPVQVSLSSGAQAMLTDALADAEAIVSQIIAGQVTDSSDDTGAGDWEATGG